MTLSRGYASWLVKAPRGLAAVATWENLAARRVRSLMHLRWYRTSSSSSGSSSGGGELMQLP
jgi:hypothetical protein